MLVTILDVDEKLMGSYQVSPGFYPCHRNIIFIRHKNYNVVALWSRDPVGVIFFQLGQ